MQKGDTCTELFECLRCVLEGEPRPVESDKGDLPPAPPLRSSNGPSSVLNKTSLEQPSLLHSILRLIVIGFSKEGTGRKKTHDEEREKREKEKETKRQPFSAKVDYVQDMRSAGRAWQPPRQPGVMQ